MVPPRFPDGGSPKRHVRLLASNVMRRVSVEKGGGAMDFVPTMRPARLDLWPMVAINQQFFPEGCTKPTVCAGSALRVNRPTVCVVGARLGFRVTPSVCVGSW